MTGDKKALLPSLSTLLIRDHVDAALREDLGRAGDVTSNATVPANAVASCVLSTRQSGYLAGIDLAKAAFMALDPQIIFDVAVDDGERVEAGDALARIKGNARAILAAERVALNFLMRMSGIATQTARYAQEIAHTNARVTCTRKTVPGHRALDKYAVACGGGSNHRFGLDDAILIKDNHIAVVGGVATAVERARAFAGHLLKVEIEVDTLDQFREALKAQPDVILLDNMTNDQLAEAVGARDVQGRSIVLEASGNVRLETIQEIAETGVDYISTSRITMAAPTLDVGLDMEI